MIRIIEILQEEIEQDLTHHEAVIRIKEMLCNSIVVKNSILVPTYPRSFHQPFSCPVHLNGAHWHGGSDFNLG
jgi:hypothetical protein